MGESCRTFDLTGGMYDNALGLHASVVLVEPSTGTVHLFRFMLVDLGALDVYFTLALDQQVASVIQLPEIVRAFFPLLVRSLTGEAERPAQFVGRLLDLVGLGAGNQ